MKKKLIYVFVSLLLLMVFATAVQAAGKPTVYSDSVVTALNEDFALPVKLKNNTGLMGFRISV